MAEVETPYARTQRERSERREARLARAATLMDQRYLRKSQAARNKAARALQKQVAKHRKEMREVELAARAEERKAVEENPAYRLEQAVQMYEMLRKRRAVLEMDAVKAKACASVDDLESQREANAKLAEFKECERKLQSAACCVRYREKQLMAQTA